MKKKRDSVFKRTIKTRFLYVPNTQSMFLDHVKVSGLKVSPARADRLFALYRYFVTETEVTPWPKDRLLIEDSLPFYKDHVDALLNDDIRLLIKLRVIQAAEGELTRSFMDMMLGN